ncbi:MULTISPECIES: response regulator transcription factor [unclassified Clostridioides]|uniref:response regulator transcription factor n=1 Tax=unclassified Clostridioides TaxID=2635829 RepID=UPI001D12E31F|nr:response regulator transcription factor [Clostridioides sp. ZZV15-6388]MCC0645312.1 response regulator transcription factor [Clostridioides sp. ZZV14-6150]MCC0661616.1 response regulator transcription factor [Clostridioides sp. ZZV14-6154]MCC0665503.1 response regulator transcription factor [Clostridioides sp. ZZV15-6597]MCC0668989.1 response regulator transcription factor [Clostridioides sp. ZZV14-6153]MCC0718195.1 response regulator transcription factor [Clostridioides sp. ZZV14-6105]MCC
MSHKIYIVEDDISISTLLKDYIEKYGFEVMVEENFDNIITTFANFKPDLVLLDVNLPKFDGFYWCRCIRQQSNIPIIFVSARDSNLDQIRALESGADDYITKPFYYDVVMAKIKSHIRRVYGEYSPKIDERILELDGLKFYPERLELELEDKTLIITKKEGILLECLIKKYPKVVSRDYLLEKIWDDIEFVEENTLNVNVSRIRKRFEELGINDAVQTVRGVGYKLNKNW